MKLQYGTFKSFKKILGGYYLFMVCVNDMVNQ